jgi:Immunoglobulin domain
MIFQLICLTVPAAIIDQLSTEDQTVQEGDMVILICNVTGIPPPDVTWYRRPASSKSSERQRELMATKHNDNYNKLLQDIH